MRCPVANPPSWQSPGRAARADVRNPILALPAFAKVRALPEPTRAHLRELLSDMADDARARADASWRAHKGPMAVYWKAVAVYAGHIRRALNAPMGTASDGHARSGAKADGSR